VITNRIPRGTRSNRSALSVWATVIAAFALVFAVASPAAAADTDDIYSGLNAARASAGTTSLAHNASLDAVALAWANQMAANNAMSHNPNTGSQIPAGWSGWGENVAYGFATGAATNAGWTASPGHYANMIGDFTDVGIAFVAAGGTTWAVEVFAKYASTAAAASSQVVTAAPATAPVAAPAAGTPATPAAAPVTSSTTAPATTAPAATIPVAETPNATTETSTADKTTAATPTPRTLAAPASSVSPATQPIVYVGLVAIPLAIALAVFLVLRARRKRGAAEVPAA